MPHKCKSSDVQYTGLVGIATVIENTQALTDCYGTVHARRAHSPLLN